MREGGTTLRRSETGGYLLVFGDGESKALEEPKDLVTLLLVMGRWRELAGMSAAEAEAYAREVVEELVGDGPRSSASTAEP